MDTFQPDWQYHTYNVSEGQSIIVAYDFQVITFRFSDSSDHLESVLHGSNAIDTLMLHNQ